MDVGSWLRGLGLGQYEAAFRESEIDADILPELTDQHLKDLGVSLGHRLKILRAIRELAATAPSADQPVAKPEPQPRDAAERRQLTVVFCDLVGSTAMSARLDPEDMRGIIGAYHKCCASLITSNGGFVAKYMGDGVLAYFGYPQAHEHDAERAVRAGLAIVEAAPKLETSAGAPLHVRVGIATGIVVVGDLLGSGEAQERGVVGDTPNLAARLQGIAEPDSVVIAESTRKLLGNLFELKDLGPRDLKGVAGPTRAYAALRASSQESRFEALHAGRLTALASALGEGEGGRGPGRSALGRGRHRQVAPGGGVPRTAGRRAACAAALLLLAAAHGQRALSDRRPHGAGRRARARRRREDQARQARRVARQIFNVFRGRRTTGRDAVSAERRPLSHP